MNRQRVMERLGPVVYRSDLATRSWNELQLHHLDRWRGHLREAKFAWLNQVELGSGILLDVGANYGQSAIAMRHHRPDRRVVCVEANPELGPCLDRLTRRDPMISAVMFGAGERWSSAELTIPTFHGSANAGGATLDPAFLDGRTDELEARYGATMTCGRRRVPVMPLGDLGFDIAAIKIDVEGLELSVLRGLGSLVRSEGARPPVMFEIRHSDGSAMAFVEREGYQLHALTSSGELGQPVASAEALRMGLDDVVALAR